MRSTGYVSRKNVEMSQSTTRCTLRLTPDLPLINLNKIIQPRVVIQQMRNPLLDDRSLPTIRRPNLPIKRTSRICDKPQYTDCKIAVLACFLGTLPPKPFVRGWRRTALSNRFKGRSNDFKRFDLESLNAIPKHCGAFNSGDVQPLDKHHEIVRAAVTPSLLNTSVVILFFLGGVGAAVHSIFIFVPVSEPVIQNILNPQLERRPSPMPRVIPPELFTQRFNRHFDPSAMPEPQSSSALPPHPVPLPQAWPLQLSLPVSFRGVPT